jgi:hypothetical protein
MPRRTRKLSNGPEMPPTAFCRNRSLSPSDAADHIGMAIQILRRGVNHSVEAVIQRPLHKRTGKRVVSGGPDTMPAANCGDRGEVDQLQHRIGWRLDPDQASVRTDRRLDGSRICHVHQAQLQAGTATAHAVEQPQRAAVEIVGGNDVRSLIKTFEQRRGRRRTRSEGESGAAVFEIGNTTLDRITGRIPGARICVTLMNTGTFLCEGRGRIDRHAHRTGGLVGPATTMNGSRREGVTIAFRHCRNSPGTDRGNTCHCRARYVVFGSCASGTRRKHPYGEHSRYRSRPTGPGRANAGAARVVRAGTGILAVVFHRNAIDLTRLDRALDALTNAQKTA